MAPIYDRLPTDSNKSWEAFEVYRDMGDGRSLTKLLKYLGEQKGIIRGMSTLEMWSSKHNWQNRVKAYDLDQENFRQEELRRVRQEAYRTELERYQKMQNQVGQGLVSLSVDAIRVLKGLISSPDFAKQASEAPISQVSSLMSATQKVADGGLTLYGQALAIEELADALEQFNIQEQ